MNEFKFSEYIHDSPIRTIGDTISNMIAGLLITKSFRHSAPREKMVGLLLMTGMHSAVHCGVEVDLPRSHGIALSRYYGIVT